MRSVRGTATANGRCGPSIFAGGGGMTETSDRSLLDMIRRHGPMPIAEMTERLGVTPTAIRNRLTRLVESGMVERRAESGGRGRPKHVYRASVAAQKMLGQNYADLAVVLWGEMMRTVEDRKLRRGLFRRVTPRAGGGLSGPGAGGGRGGPGGGVGLAPPGRGG